jgi:hypothetical protein
MGITPVRDFRFIDAMLVGILTTIDLLIAKGFLRMSADIMEFWNAVNHIDRKAKAINLIINGKFQGRIDIALFFVAAHMQISVIGATIGETVNQPRIAVEIENNRLVSGEERIKIAIA